MDDGAQIKNLVSFHVVGDEGHLRILFELADGSRQTLILPFPCLSQLVMTLPRMMAQSLRRRFGNGAIRMVYPIHKFQLELAWDRATRILSIETPDGFDVSLGLSPSSAGKSRASVRKRKRWDPNWQPNHTNQETSMFVKAYAAHSPATPLSPWNLERRTPGLDDVAIEILFCGVCHTDIHNSRGEWPGVRFPCVPGHEIVGRVRKTGREVTRFSVGDIVGVGCMVDSCRQCFACDDGLEQYCEHGFVGTYNGNVSGSGPNTYGGYSTEIVVHQNFVMKVRHESADLAAVAPLLCVGGTAWTALRRWRVGHGTRVGIVGLGGLGHIAVKLARALGANVTVFTGSAHKMMDAARLGAHCTVLSSDAEAMAAQYGRFDVILDTVAAPHALDPFLAALTLDGTLVMAGIPAAPHPSPSVFNLVMKRRQIAGTLFAGIAETQELLDFCARHSIVADVEVVAMQDIERAYERMAAGDVKFRFVIDMETLRDQRANP